ncbi:MAG: hypothetical protein RL701_1592 [Pseudomonadota bacterium]|jgi:DNA uptake protein ComE-like DNA-binding protein
MTQTVPVHSAAERTAWLGQNHGYRIAGDLACLNAEFAIAADPARAAEQWALQLWACDRPYVGGDLSGTKVAETVLEVADPNLAAAEPQRWYAETFARLPAGNRDYSMVLVLAARSAAAPARDRVLDYANYPEREHFSVPSLRGAVSVELTDAPPAAAQPRAHVRVESIENPRLEENLSGSLALELWALAEPYAGGLFVGEALAGVEIGRLAGQQSLQSLEFDLSLAAREPNAANQQHVLMLREWTAGGYVTRDYRNLPSAATAVTAVAIAPVTVIRDVKPAEPVVAAVAPVAAKVALVSIQHASVAELSVVEGLNRKLAAEIIKGRPYRSLDDLTRIRGIGEKTLRRLRGVLTL